jgi:hypothetical protein
MTISKKAPEGADVLDLGAARAARAEARAGHPNPVIRLSSGFVDLKPEMDILIAEDLTGGKVKSALVRLLADPADADALLAEGISDDDLKAIIEFATGKNLGESSASSKLSLSSGKK